MYKDKKILAIVPAYNEEAKIGSVVSRCENGPLDTLLVVDDASTDRTAQVAAAKGATVITMPSRSGVGAAIRSGLQYGKDHDFDLVVILAGNNKDNPQEITRLLDPICDSQADFVIGSRHLSGGRTGGDMPFYRKLATRIHPWLMQLFTGKSLTESTNGFRAFKLSLIEDPRIRLNQHWLDNYGLEVYLLWKVLKLHYKHIEVPCTKVYPPKSMGYTKMKPIIGWWNILRPIFLLGFGIRQ